MATSMTSQWIEDIPIQDMKLYFDSFKQMYKEFDALSELTLAILQSMGIILKGLSSPTRRTQGKITNRFTEFDDEDEQEMEEEGVYSSTNRADILTMQNAEDFQRKSETQAGFPESPFIESGNYLNRGESRKQNTPFTSHNNHELMALTQDAQTTDLHFGTENRKYRAGAGSMGQEETEEQKRLHYASA